MRRKVAGACAVVGMILAVNDGPRIGPSGAAGSDWPQFRAGPAYPGAVPAGSTVTPAGVAGLTAAWGRGRDPLIAH